MEVLLSDESEKLSSSSSSKAAQHDRTDGQAKGAKVEQEGFEVNRQEDTGNSVMRVIATRAGIVESSKDVATAAGGA